MIRRRCGLSLEVVAGLIGITKGYLSMLENGQRGFNRRGLVEDLAAALGCSVVGLTGQPYPPPNRTSAETLAALPGIREIVYDATVDDAPQVQARSVAQFAAAVRRANEFCDAGRYGPAGGELGALLAELHVHTAVGGDNRRAALPILVAACHVAAAVAEVVGHQDLALACAVRESEAAEALGDDSALSLLSAYSLGQTRLKVGARRKAAATFLKTVEECSNADPNAPDTAAAEMAGMVHLGSALLGARGGDPDAVTAHLAEAASLAKRTGERNTQLQHFGPINVALWKVALAVDLGDGVAAAEAVEADPIPVELLGSSLRSANLWLDLARGWAQAEGDRDAEAIRALDAADRTAPTMVRNHPLARELLDELYGRARRCVWELDSLHNRFDISNHGSRAVNN
jgi:transcriptional regulator with XRE-family HTH domain